MSARLDYGVSASTSLFNFGQLDYGVNEPAIESLPFCSIYDIDPRPTFIVDVTSATEARGPDIVYSNPALERSEDIFVCVKNVLSEQGVFRDWVLLPHDGHSQRYGGVLWFGFNLQHKWKVISAATLTSKPSDDDDDACISPTATPSYSRSIDLTCDERAEYEAAITRLKEETRSYPHKRRQASREKESPHKTFSRLEEDTCRSRSTASSANTSWLAWDDDDCRSASPLWTSYTSDRDNLDNDIEVEPRDTTIKRVSSAELHSSLGSFVSQIIPTMRDVRGRNASMVLAKFQELAEAVNLGFFDFDTEGRLLYANESWYALSGHPRAPERHTTLTFNQCVHPEDISLVASQWSKLLSGQPTTFEMRWKKPVAPDATGHAALDVQWVSSACVPVFGEDGRVRSISGCTTDINAQKLNEQVALQKAAALERARTSEERFSRFAEVAPIAIFRLDRHRNLEYCNDRWFDMTGITRTRFEDVKWPFGIFEEDIEMCAQAWGTAMPDHCIGQIEFRLQKEWHDAHERHGPTWVCCTFFPEYAEDGTFSGLMGSLLNISHIKWAEIMQKSRAEEALKAKQQQENFIDITSHEMRNPLSAMVQCADTILMLFDDVAKVTGRLTHVDHATEHDLLNEYVNTGLDAVQTILSCAAHQKRIVDDILTLSKLDADLLLITPIATNPIAMVRDVLKMFEMDCSRAGVELCRELSSSFEELNVQGLMLDPSRVSQILINLLGNAIKFTKNETEKKVTVRMSVSAEPPSKSYSNIGYVPPECGQHNLDDLLESNGEIPLYLKFEVQDTGRGLTPEEKDKLFMRFSQASPKTHVQYGGSGLGLFICKKLTEMQGGEIGFASEADVGSTFAFYIRTWKTTCSGPKASGYDHMITTSDHHESPCSVSSPQYHHNQQRTLNVLLVEDNLVNQKVLRKQLEAQGCTVFVAGHGGEALEFLQSTDLGATVMEKEPPLTSPLTSTEQILTEVSIDAVLMDIEMPVMGGLECTHRIRELEKDGMIRRHLPIVSISANARQEQVDEARGAGVDDTISKPFRVRELMPKLHDLVECYHV